MSRQLTTPRSPVPDSVQQIVTGVRVEIGLDPAVPPATGAVPVASRTVIVYDITEVAADGTPIKNLSGSASLADWPAGVRDAVRDLLRFADTHGAASGVLDPGTHTDDV